MALFIAIAAARFLLGLGKCRLIILLSITWGMTGRGTSQQVRVRLRSTFRVELVNSPPTTGMNIIATYRPAVLGESMPSRYTGNDMLNMEMMTQYMTL